ncbi:stage V sporulation protein S [Rhodoplanes sp. Z2-YC6860]|nr:stage V sporulation protein S [Rhodoplanes sp. Z2-YC6860]
MRDVRRLWRLPWRDFPVFLEAFIFLAATRFVIAVLPFRKAADLAARPVRQSSLSVSVTRLRLKQVRWAIVAASRRAPWRTLCFEQGLTAQCMLRRRGIASTLYYGVAQDQSGLSAHVWVRAGHQDVIGCENAAQFSVLASFPRRVVDG